MRLTCPRCAAQYQIADTAIPPAGREVECSACGHVWHQEAPGKSAPDPAAATPGTGFDPQARPVLNRALDESVLSILREEAARELRVRKGEAPEPATDHIPATTPEPSDAEAPPAPQIDWPATTLTMDEAGAPVETPAQPVVEGVAEPAPEPAAPEPPASAHPAAQDPAPDAITQPIAQQPVPQPQRPEPVLPALPDAAELAATLTRPALPEPSPAPPPDLEAARTALRPAAPAEDSPAAAAAPVLAVMPAPQRSGYGSGFGLAAMLALGLVALYAVAPQIPPGKGGTLLAEWRQGIDRGRLWLHDRIFGD